MVLNLRHPAERMGTKATGGTGMGAYERHGGRGSISPRMPPLLCASSLSVLITWCWLLLIPPSAAAAPSSREQAVGQAIDIELEYLLGFVGPGRTDPRSFQIERMANTLSFIDSTKSADIMHHARPRRGAPSAYFEVDVNRPLADVLRLTYDTNIPAVVTAPSTVRLARWKRIDPRRLAQLWESSPNLHAPLSILGTEHVVNTPDAHSGAYYSYDLDRTLLLLPLQKRTLFISLSAQRRLSSVGKQGLIVGPDDQWNYLYTERPGLNWPGLGWVESYMYDSYSAAFYLNSPSAPRPVRFGVFKWLRAGWGGINIVKSSHIHDGLRRFGTVFKAILESPHTADVDALTAHFAALRSLPNESLRQCAEDYFRHLQNRFPSREANAILTDRRVRDHLGREEMLSLVSLERLKAVLGKPNGLNPERSGNASAAKP